jgi:hypothetical protein
MTPCNKAVRYRQIFADALAGGHQHTDLKRKRAGKIPTLLFQS